MKFSHQGLLIGKKTKKTNVLGINLVSCITGICTKMLKWVHIKMEKGLRL
jgi:hypothetical protein